MDFPSIALLNGLGISPLIAFTCWMGWQLVKINKGIQDTLHAHDKRIDKVEWEQGAQNISKGT
ncbi:hypothetical protein [Moritella viscosa]|uniref:hypothetical protein n=1 Tax=Moritella viscosa TaxID=80854 RepID=UPI000922C857|nr:hypothetical protein [Moritella viscosa]SGY98810.1 Putative uncharacterized protein [Moritella viscosa]